MPRRDADLLAFAQAAAEVFRSTSWGNWSQLSQGGSPTKDDLPKRSRSGERLAQLLRWEEPAEA